MILDIVQAGDPVLRRNCEQVKTFDEKLWRLLDDMKDTLKDAQGAGLAAPQVNVPLRIALVDVDEGFFEFINPIFVWQKGEQTGDEGCLSLRGKVGTVTRPNKVKIIFQDRNGVKCSLVARDFFARAICHEFDHLDGVLYIDKAFHIRESEADE